MSRDDATMAAATTGELLPPPTPPQPQPLDADGVVRGDLPCRKCGYNLRGLHADGRCPECGTVVRRSVHGDLLRYSDPVYVNRLARGAGLVLWGTLVVLGGVVATIVLGIALGAGVAEPLRRLLLLAGSALVLVGTWLLTEPDPSSLGEDQYGTARRVVRVTLVLGVVGVAVDLAGGSLPLPVELRPVLLALSILFGLAGAVGTFAQLYYLSKLALRIPDEPLAGRARFLMYGMGIGQAVIVLFGAVALLGGVAAAAGCAMLPVGVAMIVFAVMYLFFIARLARRFKQEADAAAANWASTAPPPG